MPSQKYYGVSIDNEAMPWYNYTNTNRNWLAEQKVKNMRDLNIDFMDLYKRADRFIKDAYSSSEGVSEYIRLMEDDFIKGSSNIQGWKRDFDNLKHIRWIRNQLAHEVSYDSEICSVNEYEWLEEFYERLFSAEDPLAVLRKIEMKAASERVGKRQPDNNSYQTPREVYTPPQGSRSNKPDGCLIAFVMIPIIIAIMIFVPWL